MHLHKSVAAWAAAISNNLPFDGLGALNSLIAVFFSFTLASFCSGRSHVYFLISLPLETFYFGFCCLL